jgi:hypothetical protein
LTKITIPDFDQKLKEVGYILYQLLDGDDGERAWNWLRKNKFIDSDDEWIYDEEEDDE